jgi:hypothetical protein
MTPEERARKLALDYFGPNLPARSEKKISFLELAIADAVSEAERLAYERAAQLLEKRAALFMVTPSEIYNAHLMSVELIVSAKRVRALSQPETPATPSTDEEVRAWCERVYRETGVTPALRAAYEFYKANYRGETPAEKTEGT